MRIAVMGAGAVGCCYGGWAAEAGHSVVLIGRPALAETVAARGLRFTAPTGAVRDIPLEAATDPAAVAGADLVLFCVKNGDTAEAGAAIAPHLAPGAILLSMQNGVGGAERLSAATGRPALPVAVYVAAGMEGPGHVAHHGRNELIIGEGPGAEAAAEALRAGGSTVEVSAGAEAAQWAKLTMNCAWNALSAITRQPYGALWRQEGIRGTIAALIEECTAVAAAEGVTIPGDPHQAAAGIASGMPGQFSSTAQDMMRGRRTEIAYLNGEIARRAARHGVPVPVNAALLALVEAMEPAA